MKITLTFQEIDQLCSWLLLEYSIYIDPSCLTEGVIEDPALVNRTLKTLFQSLLIQSFITFKLRFNNNQYLYEIDNLSDIEVEGIKEMINGGENILILSTEEMQRLNQQVSSETWLALSMPIIGFPNVDVELRGERETGAPLQAEVPNMYVLSGDPSELDKIKKIIQSSKEVEKTIQTLTQFNLLNQHAVSKSNEKINTDQLLQILKNKLTDPNDPDAQQLKWLVNCIEDEKPTTADVVRGMLEDLETRETPIGSQLKEEIEQLLSPDSAVTTKPSAKG